MCISVVVCIGMALIGLGVQILGSWGVALFSRYSLVGVVVALLEEVGHYGGRL